MGEVFRAHHRLLRRPCAVKLIRADQAGSPSILARFEREVQAMAKLNHPNTVEIYDYGRSKDGTLYYAMEYLPGLTLDALVRHYGVLSPARAIYLFHQVCRALREAHDVGLIHRDIKPSNIIIAERGGEYDVVKLLDFGLVHIQKFIAGINPEEEIAPEAARPSSDQADTQLTEAGHILGTPSFMSPEQAEGIPVDARSDIYSLGAVAYFALTKRLPFERGTTVELIQAHINARPQPPSELEKGIPKDLEAVILRCLSKSPEERYASALELDMALAACGVSADWNSHLSEAWWRSIEPGSASELPASEASMTQDSTRDS